MGLGPACLIKEVIDRRCGGPTDVPPLPHASGRGGPDVQGNWVHFVDSALPHSPCTGPVQHNFLGGFVIHLICLLIVPVAFCAYPGLKTGDRYAKIPTM